MPQPCLHCGEPSQYIEKDEAFCCHGCESIFHFLKQENLSHFYELDPSPAKKVESIDERELERLHDDAFAQRFELYQDERRQKVRLSCPAIHCRACVWLLEKIPQITEGVLDSKVDMMRKRVELSFDRSSQSLYRLAQLLNQLGYPPDLRSSGEEAHSKHQREEWLRIGVAGFCFGNVMLFSFPEYLGGEDLGASFEVLFRWLCFIISLPVFLYCSKGLLTAGVKAIRYKGYGVDLPIALGLCALFGMSCFDVITGRGSGYFDSLCGLVFFLLMGRAFQRHSFQNLVFERDEHRFFPLVVTLIKDDGTSSDIPCADLKTGDDYQLLHGGLVPTDSIVLEGDVALDYRLVTGETDWVRPKSGSKVFAGGLQQAGKVKLKALLPVKETSLAQLWAQAGDTESPKLEQLLDRCGQWFTLVVLLLAFTTAGIWWSTSPARAIELSCAVLIIACPCALALSAPLTLGAGIRQLSKWGCYVKSAADLEAMATVDAVVFDKTGTLTQIDQDCGSFGSDVCEEDQAMARLLASHSNHPIAVAMSTSGPLFDGALKNFEEFQGKGMKADILKGETWMKVECGAGHWCCSQDPSVADQTVLMINQVYVGVFKQALVWRKGVTEALEELRKRSQLYLLSGDNDRDRSRLIPFFEDQNMYFGCDPQSKGERVQHWVQQGANVAMIGDGVNDGIAMRSASVGIAIPVGSGRFTPTCDVMVSEDQVGQLSKFLTYAQQCRKWVVICIVISLLYNGIGVSAAMGGWISPLVSAILMPLSSISVMAISLLGTASSTKVFQVKEREISNS